jgi:glycosyltransferase involved in cell wall biosynthesis
MGQGYRPSRAAHRPRWCNRNAWTLGSSQSCGERPYWRAYRTSVNPETRAIAPQRNVMRLGLDGLRLMSKRLGVGRYIEYMLRYWPETRHPFSEIVAYTPGPIPGSLPLHESIRVETLAPALPPALWEHAVLPLRKRRDDLFFCPSYVVPLLSSEHPVVVTHHGSYEALPSAFAWWPRTRARFVYQQSCRRADVVITVSESSRDDIVRFYGIDAKKIRIIPEGVDDAFQPIDDAARLEARRRSYFADGRPFILFVGKMTARRHLPDLIDAFARMVRREKLPHGLVLLGPDTVGHSLPKRFADLGIADRVVHRDFATHEELVEAYNAADVFIYPSDYEGFGIPVLEAIACGTPAITLNNSAFPEFAGGIAYFARDGSSESLDHAMTDVLRAKGLREQVRRDGPVRAESYRWRRIAFRTMDVLAEVAGGR